MRYLALVGLMSICVASVSYAADAASPPDTLTLQDLVNRPDHWPSSIPMAHDLRFTSTAIVHQGDAAQIVRFDGTKVLLIDKTIRFTLTPDDCGLLDAANKEWSALTPEQRAVTPASLAADPSIWPLKIKTTNDINASYGKLPAGSEVDVFSVKSDGVDVSWPKTSKGLVIGFDLTDIFQAARKLMLIDAAKRPSRIAAALKPLLVSADGTPYKDEHLEDKKVFLIYYGAGWCQPCLDFSPSLVKYLTDALPKHPELMAVMVNEDHSLPEMLKYMQMENMPFPAVPPDKFSTARVLTAYAGQEIPDVAVVDRFGKVLATNDDLKNDRGDPKDTIAALAKILDAQPAQP